MFFPDYKSVEDRDIRAKVEAAWGTTLDPKKGLTVVEIMNAVHAGVIKGMYIMGENPAMSDPDLNHVRHALAHLKHLVVQDIFLTETAPLRTYPACPAGRRRTAPSPTPIARSRWGARRCRCRAKPSRTG
jgi:predicted molibdopterin-dependent oxidoreductase YjgC